MSDEADGTREAAAESARRISHVIAELTKIADYRVIRKLDEDEIVNALLGCIDVLSGAESIEAPASPQVTTWISAEESGLRVNFKRDGESASVPIWPRDERLPPFGQIVNSVLRGVWDEFSARGPWPVVVALYSADHVATLESIARQNRELAATHRCRICGALWIAFGSDPVKGGWSLASRSCGTCCDNVEMGEQIEVLRPNPADPPVTVCASPKSRAAVAVAEALREYRSGSGAWADVRARLDDYEQVRDGGA